MVIKFSGTLYKYLDNCVTSSGKRLLRRWICHPLKDIEGINNRLNVVEALVEHSELMALVAQYLRKLPDLERLLGRIRASVQSSAILSVPVFGKKVLKQKVSLLYLEMKFIFMEKIPNNYLKSGEKPLTEWISMLNLLAHVDHISVIHLSQLTSFTPTLCCYPSKSISLFGFQFLNFIWLIRFEFW